MAGYQWLEELHKLCYDTLIRLAKSRLYWSDDCLHDAEEVVQQAFLLATEKDISTHEAPVQWMMKTVSNLCLNRLKKQQRARQKWLRLIRQRLDGSADRSASAVEQQESGMEVREMMMLLEQVLTPEECELLRKYCLENIPPSDLAAQNGMSPGALRVRIHRLRKKLEENGCPM